MPAKPSARSHPTLAQILDVLRDGFWVHNADLMLLVRNANGDVATPAVISHAVHRMRDLGITIETGTFYRLADDPAQWKHFLSPRKPGRQPIADGRVVRYENGADRIRLGRIWWDRLGKPERVALQYDPTRRLLAITPLSTGRKVSRHTGARSYVEIACRGICDALGLPPREQSAPLDVMLKQGRVIARMRTSAYMCQHCNGRGVINEAPRDSERRDESV